MPIVTNNLKLWLDAADAATLFQNTALTTPAAAEGDSVGGWMDKSGYANHATQASSGIRLKYSPAGPLVYSGPADLGLGSASINFPTSLTYNRNNCSLFFVTDYASLLAQNVLFELGTGANVEFKNNNQFLQCYVDTADTGSSPGIYPATNKAVIGFVSSPTGLKFYCNSTVGTAGAMSSQSQTGGTLFQLNYTGYYLFAAGNLYEVALYDAALSTSDVAALLNYFNCRHTIHTYDANRVVCLGDSITAGYASTGNRSFPARLLKLAPLGTRVYNLGVGSRTAATLDAGLPTQSAPYYSSAKPCVGVVFAGTNDLNAGVSAATVLASLQSACGKLRTQGYVAVVCNVLPRGGAIGGFETARTSLNASLAANWSTFADKFVDLAADSRLSSVNGTYYAADNLHLNNAGYGVVGDLVYAKISGYLKFPQARGGVIGSGVVGAAP